MRPPYMDEEKEGVTRPEATEGGLAPKPTVGEESLVVATKTPHMGGQEKYCLPLTEPSFFPFPTKPPLSSTPAQRPDLPSMSPKYCKIPSNPSDSILTLSPTSKARPARLMLLPNTSDCRLAGRAVGVRDRSSVDLWAAAEDDEETEGGRPATDRRPDWATEDGGDDCRLDTSLARLLRCWAGSFALMASAKARDMYSTSEDTGG